MTQVPEELVFEYCQGQAKIHTGDPNNIHRNPVKTGGYLMVDLLNGGNIINMNALEGTNGYPHKAKDGKTCVFREIVSLKKKVSKSFITYTGAMPMIGGVGGAILNLHQVTLATGRHYGINTNDEAHHEEGGILSGILDEGETMAKFDCVSISPGLKTLVAKGLKNCSNICDGDHLFGRSSKYLNGVWSVQGVSNRENIVRHHVRERVGEWLLPLIIGDYSNVQIKDRRMI